MRPGARGRHRAIVPHGIHRSVDGERTERPARRAAARRTFGPMTPPPFFTSPRRIAQAIARIGGTSPLVLIVPLGLAATGVLLWRDHTGAERLVIGWLTLLVLAWGTLWHRLLERYQGAPPEARIGWLVPLTWLGGGLLGLLARQDVILMVAMIPLVPRSFLTLPYWVAYPFTLCFLLPADFALIEELSRPTRTAPALLAALHVLIVGLLGLILQSIRAQTREREALLRSLATSERVTGQLEERQRLAGEIHDTLAQGFAAILTHLEAAELSRHDAAVAWRHVTGARDVAREQLEEARRMMTALRPEALDERDLGEAIRRTAHAWAQRTGIPCEIAVTGDALPLHRDLEVALLRAAQEALANVWRHARASRAAVTLSYIGDVVALDVMDDGVGGVTADGAGFGLGAMTERMERLGGTLAIESAPGEGTTLTATLPVMHATAERPLPPAEPVAS